MTSGRLPRIITITSRHARTSSGRCDRKEYSLQRSRARVLMSVRTAVSKKRMYRKLKLLLFAYLCVQLHLVARSATMKQFTSVKRRLVVTYNYYENQYMDVCTKVIKRRNLYTFLTGAVGSNFSESTTFIFTVSGELPHPTSFYTSIGINANSDSIFPSLSNVYVNRVSQNSDHSTPDLCYHSQVMKRIFAGEFGRFDTLLFVNDGVRAPFVKSALTHQWIRDLMHLLYSDDKICAVAPVVSCEKSLHLQAWYVLVKLDLLKSLDLHRVLEATCGSSISWDDAVDIEVNFTTTILKKGYKVAAEFPSTQIFSNKEKETIEHALKKAHSWWPLQKSQNLVKKLRYCTNPLSPKSAGPLDYRKLSAVKVGGGFLRANFFSQQDRRQALHNLTAQVIGAYDSGAAWEACDDSYTVPH